MSFTEAELDNLSILARIDIMPEEKQKMLADMQAILGYISEINQVSVVSSNLEQELINVVREDVVTRETGSNTETLLKEAPATEDGYVKVMQVLK
ncbi:MAG: Asp-tRNA(Asn)/Glu-tRNA(Gln) amidotransferase subunit GatC [Candidatus Taylorbacteria bacterium]|nr:Asp-tRNA(Asn)/Glu-tRNA(Gln) amidotransferase subunit GatC [Candidatus Taylorbacteria bacterium]